MYKWAENMHRYMSYGILKLVSQFYNHKIDTLVVKQTNIQEKNK